MVERVEPTASPSADAAPFVFEHRERALFLVVAAGLVLATSAVDVALQGGLDPGALGIRLAWALLLVATAAVVRRGVVRPIRIMGPLAAFGSVGLYLLLVARTGRSRSQSLSFVNVLVMTLPMVMPEALGKAVAAAALLLAGGGLFLWRGGARPAELLEWGHVGLAALGIAALLAHALRRARLAEAASNAARLRAQEALARSERRAAEADKLAALGALSGEIAHEINNPLAAARSTATFLRDRLPPADEEGRAAGADLVASLDRIARSVWRLGHGARTDAAAEGEAEAPPEPPAR